ncbi:alpha-galactosidase [Fragilaria crotonensis]|nr:alpha-galactosidase [Fragilaria crotonensis]
MTYALDNGVALTPPMGFNSYMAGKALQNEVGLLRVAEFMLDHGMRTVGYRYINTDEGWEESTRDASTGTIRWNETLYPSSLPVVVERLHNLSFYFGIYGAASAVTCGENPGQLYHERHDAAVWASWGVDYVKSDNCASYALDSSVRFRAMRDALNATGRPMVLSIEPFSIHPDPAQSSQVANMWRTGVDIEGTWDAILDRADMADKWAPLAGPRAGWNDPDMINVHNGLTIGENRVYFGLWAIMKAPLIVSTDLFDLDRNILDIITNREVIEINQDVLGIPARKVLIDGLPVPWKVDIEDCSFPDQSLLYSRQVAHDMHGVPRAGPGTVDTRLWKVVDSGSQTDSMTHYEIRNEATGRCLAQSNGTTVVLLPCTGAPSQLWLFDKGITTVTSITNVEVKLALAISATALYSQVHGRDSYPVSDRAYGEGSLILVKPMDQDSCTSRSCENYEPEQMWYYSPVEGMLRHSLFTASMNHIEMQNQDKEDGYILTPKVPTSRHNCLAHVLSTANTGTESGICEVWTGPLSGGSIVVAFVNRGHDSTPISIPLESLTTTMTATATAMATSSSLPPLRQSYLVRDSWNARDLDVVHPGESVQLDVLGHDMAVLRLIPLSRTAQLQSQSHSRIRSSYALSDSTRYR